MINLHNDIVKSISYMDSKSYEDRAYFARAYDILFHHYQNNATNTNHQRIKEAYELFFSQHQELIGHYFRNLYRIIKYIHEADVLSLDEKRNYVGIIRAQLSTYELLMIFYNGMSTYGIEKFLPLIKEYNLLKNMNKDLLIIRNHWTIYENL